MTTTLNASTAGAGGFIATSDNSGSLALQTAGTTAITVDASQNVGIGTASPSSYGKFAIRGGITASINGTNFSGISFETSDAANSSFYINHTSGYANLMGDAGLALYTGNPTVPAERMRIDTSGNVLVGTTSALSQTGRATFVGTGNAIITQVANGNTAFQSTNTSGTGSYYAAIWGNNGNSFSTCGTIQVSGSNTSYNTSSDYRLKEDVQPMTGALAKVALLKPVTYKWKSDGTESEGFIAHELAEVCPHAVSGEKDALKEDGSIMPQGIDTSFLVATLTAAIQEQQATINALTARIVALETA